ncbi:MAG: 3-isopropylmalate dehydratase small subunit [Candidatus Tectomicrobia bacterium]|uniref:3-isopropylmalate dehydratase small subunit n=1 Tax=Tectimicrobiota bacterium TaxID=2528274 RepID=A0A932GME1_UNCTE|nr:3-isopropylmalate dehydratase small subunit [Candidatus Tectomicrobia bacterium]
MILKGRVWRYGDNVDTDVLYPSKYLVTFDLSEVGKHALEGLDPEFSREVKAGDIIVAGRNFGCGSAREQAATAIKAAGVSVMLAESFSRTFYRNAINVGLPVLVVPGIGKLCAKGDLLEVRLEEGRIRNLGSGSELQVAPLPDFVLQILAKGGAIPYYRERMAPHGRVQDKTTGVR